MRHDTCSCHRITRTDSVPETRAVVVELVGLPGVGKSFLCRSLAKLYAADVSTRVQVSVEADTSTFGTLGMVFEKLCRAARFTVAHPETTVKLIRVLRSKGRMLHGGRPSKLINLLAETDRSAHVAPTETWISEQGVLQAVWSLEMRSNESVHVELLDALSRWLPEKVVFVETDRAEYESRLKHREGGRSHFDRLRDDGLPEAIERGQQRAREMLDIWAHHVSDADRLDFWNGERAPVGDIVEWVRGKSAVRTTTSLHVDSLH